MVASNFSTQSLALLFTFAFQVHGEVIVQSDNVTFPGYADLPALFGPGLPVSSLLLVPNVSPHPAVSSCPAADAFLGLFFSLSFSSSLERRRATSACSGC